MTIAEFHYQVQSSYGTLMLSRRNEHFEITHLDVTFANELDTLAFVLKYAPEIHIDDTLYDCLGYLKRTVISPTQVVYHIKRN